MRFPIGASFKAPFGIEADAILKFFHPLFDYVEKVLAQGKNILIHCVAGAHRAGTTGTAWLMYKNKLGAKDAIKLAKQMRPIINPYMGFIKQLAKLEEAFGQEGLYEEVCRIQDPEESLRIIQSVKTREFF